MSSEPDRDPYLGVVFILLGLTVFGAVGAAGVGWNSGNPVLLDVGVMLGIASGVLMGVALARIARSHRPEPEHPRAVASLEGMMPLGAAPAGPTGLTDVTDVAVADAPTVAVPTEDLVTKARRLAQRLKAPSVSDIDGMPSVIGGAGVFALVVVFFHQTFPIVMTRNAAAIGVVACLVAAGIAAATVRYLDDIDAADLPEGIWLRRGARVLAWSLVLGAASIALRWLEQPAPVRIIHALLFLVNAALCAGLTRSPSKTPRQTYVLPLDLAILTALGNRANVFASILDAGEQQLGIDIRSTWAITVIRRSVEPLVAGLALVGWLATSITVIGTSEQGLVERLGVTVGGDPLGPGIHLHLPWPVDRVFRIPVDRVQTIAVGHEGEEAGGPEDVLWARQHAANEYTLLLGDGRDLITVDATVQFRIADARAWRYRTQNPVDALRAIGYRAVMRNTVDRTLEDALSENVVAATARMRKMVQEDSDALGLGVEILGFTVGGMHPPVPVALAYQAVVSSQLASVTAVVNAQAERNQLVPTAEASVIAAANKARAEDVNARALATGESWSFLALQSQYGASPQEYMFRRRLETMERNLAQRRFTVVDSRFLRDGGELWINP
jgi:regulator of protease activity HflC (stomatin/prohibitin superfamily)